jgi:hypothetical protein
MDEYEVKDEREHDVCVALGGNSISQRELDGQDS